MIVWYFLRLSVYLLFSNFWFPPSVWEFGYKVGNAIPVFDTGINTETLIPKTGFQKNEYRYFRYLEARFYLTKIVYMTISKTTLFCLFRSREVISHFKLFVIRLCTFYTVDIWLAVQSQKIYSNVNTIFDGRWILEVYNPIIDLSVKINQTSSTSKNVETKKQIDSILDAIKVEPAKPEIHSLCGWADMYMICTDES